MWPICIQGGKPLGQSVDLTGAAGQVSIQLSNLVRRPHSTRQLRIALSFGDGNAGVEAIGVVAHGKNQDQQFLFSLI